MNRLAVMLMIVMLLATGAAAVAVAPDPAGAAGSGAQLNEVHARIDQLEQQIADGISRKAKADEYTGRAIQADINFRIIARALLTAGAKAGPSGSLAMLYGQTLANHADEAKALFDRLPKMVTLARDPKQKLSEDQKLAVSKFADAIARFNTVTADKKNTLAGVDARSVDHYLQTMLSPMTTMTSTLNAGDITSTWLRPVDRDDAAAVLPPRLSSNDLDAMVRRIHAVRLTTATKSEMLSMVDLLRQGLTQPDLRPRVAAFYELLDQALVVAEAFTSASWADAKTLDDFRSELHTAILLVKDPRTRDGGVARFQSLSRSLDVLDRIGKLNQLAVPIGTLRDLFLVSHKLLVEQRDLHTAHAMLDYLRRLTRIMLAERDLLGDPLPLDIKRVALSVEREYQQRELKLINDLRTLVNNPSQVEDPRWTDPLDDLAEAEAIVRRVHRIPHWVDELARFKPRPANGLYRALRDIAVELTDAQHRADGLVALKAFDEQVMRFDPMPLEQALRGSSPAIEKATGGANLLMAEQMDRLRSDWASAWASQDDPGPIVAKLDAMRRLLHAVDMQQRIGDLDQAITRLNRWAAWEVAPEAIRPLMSVLPNHITQGCRDAAIGDWAALDPILEQIDKESTLPLLVAHLYGELGTNLDKLPTHLVGALSQGLYAPTPDAIGADDRQSLARICVYLMEAAHARSLGDSAQIEAAMNDVSATAEKLLKPQQP